MFSLDSTTPETLKKVRGVDKLAKIEAAVFRMLRVRGDRDLPRVGVSFTTQSTNLHEEQEFVDRWVGVVDVVRMGIVFENGTFPDMVEPPKRVPCAVIYKTMPVHNDGSVRLCCLDGVRATDMGNVFENGVKENLARRGIRQGALLSRDRAVGQSAVLQGLQRLGAVRVQRRDQGRPLDPPLAGIHLL